MAIYDQKKIYKKIQFLVIKTLDPEPDPDSLEILDRDPNSMNPDPQHWDPGPGS